MNNVSTSSDKGYSKAECQIVQLANCSITVPLIFSFVSGRSPPNVREVLWIRNLRIGTGN
jgi:hypothetical protein